MFHGKHGRGYRGGLSRLLLQPLAPAGDGALRRAAPLEQPTGANFHTAPLAQPAPVAMLVYDVKERFLRSLPLHTTGAEARLR